ncbi:DDT domain-containing protein PTM isoform X2 [Morus notabilis]|uniref:DDT domain-containing protein PTM isoform X2 n=1 Tax=Morus notabilis TaxID=981085 RepID=UPI000CED0C02|nr:DDT domain-containing protein PTM isoform X2 [Morus notabilis]
MEFVGRAVRRELDNGGGGGGDGEGEVVFSLGTVKSYDASSRLFKVVYEDGDSEELGLSEVAMLVEGKIQLGRKPKKRRRIERSGEELGEPGNAGQNLIHDCSIRGGNETLVSNHDGFLNDAKEGKRKIGGNGNLKEGENLLGKMEGLKEGVFSVNGDVNGVGDLRDGLDLNAGFNLNLNDDSDEHLGSEGNSRKLEHIDLNLDVNDDFDESLTSPVEIRRRGCDFDLNMEVVDDTKDGGEELKVSTCFERAGNDARTNDGDEEKIVEDVDSNGALTKVDLDINEDVSAKGVSDLLESSVRDACAASAEQLNNDCSVSGEDAKPDPSAVVLDTNSAKDCDATEIELKDGPYGAGTPMMNHEHLDDSATPSSQKGSRRKRRKLSDNVKAPTPTVLRRSARRGSAQNHVSITSCTVNDIPSSPAVSAITEEKPGTSVWKEPEKPVVVLPPKLQLPPSSQSLDLKDIPILDLFSVYACLRSFSTLLFLSPFELEEFVAAVKCKSPTSLFDNVHISILRTLRKHLEYLSNEGSESASDCLRSLNWNFLDVITWPMFMAEYFVIHGSELKPSFDLSSLKLFKADYYQQPASIKIEILRCLCDDLIEVEAIRSELNRRSLAAEPDMSYERNLNHRVGKKRRASLGISGGSCLEEEDIDNNNDWNYDECCLCKMDGSLICCDGCPAAYHSSCVGIANEHLPEGDWYCPECAIARDKPWIKSRKSLRGAELLGIDPYGRLYFNSSGYLLVSDSYDTESPSSYYHRDDLNMVIDVLKTSDFFYGDILVAICKHWSNVSLNGTSSKINCLYSVSADMSMKGQSHVLSYPPVSLASAELCAVKNESVEERKMEENTKIEDSGLGSQILKSVNKLDAITVTGSSHVTSEGSAEITQTQTQTWSGTDYDLTSIAKTQNQSVIQGKLTTVDMRQEAIIESAGPENPSTCITTRKGNTSEVQYGNGYVNYYSFGQIASSIAEDLTRKSSDKIKQDVVILEEEIISRQMRVILKKYSKFCWSSIKTFNVDVQKEKCGWCFSCRAATDDRECLFSMNVGPVREFPSSDDLSLQSKRNRKSHLTDIIYQILSIENRLRGLLLGPWLNPNHTKLWRKSALKASDIASVKHFLLTLESNLGRLALSADWLKHVDSDVSVGSASHIVTSSARGSLKNVIGRKRPITESGPTLNTASGLGIFWWRGGRLSRKVFNWKVLPCSLVSKAARQGGCTKIPGILYPENSEYAKRSKYVAWQAAVETSTSAEQLAFQVRELDSHIKWDDIENTHPLPVLDKESRKSIRLFKKVIVRRKSVQGGLVKYLLDFGKRRAIPDVVSKHGSMVEESSSERKKYWLDESYLPLHLLKNFEEKRIARKSTDNKSGKSVDYGSVMKRPQQKKGFAYLFSKAERSEYYQCGHCNKDVLIREAVSCQHCKGFFHKRHVKKSAGAIIAECTYTCHRCQNGVRAKIDTKKGKTAKKGGNVKSKQSKNIQTDRRSSQLKSNKKVSTVGQKGQSKKNSKAIPAVPLRRSTRKAKCLSLPNKLQNKKHRGRKKGKQVKAKKATQEKTKKGTSCRKKRTAVSHSYWLNGLLLSRKPNDERVVLFRDKSFLAPPEQSSDTPNQPKCQLCDEAGYKSTLNYVACETCREWFHADAIGIHPENIDIVIGFRCHTCCERTPPVCLHSVTMQSDVSQLAEVQNTAAVDCTEEVSNTVPPLSEVACN